MDYAFMNALLRTTNLPAEDMWLSGFAMPYYYLGYLLVGLPAKIAGTPGPMAYSLAVVLVFASGFGAALSIVYGLVAKARCGVRRTRRRHRSRWRRGRVDAHGRASRCALPRPPLPYRATGRGRWARASTRAFGFGLLGGTLTMIVGNLAGVFELIAARGWGSPDFWAAVGVKGLRRSASATLLPVEGGWWWRSSRVIPNIPPDGITEFPYFSFLLGDLHPHYIGDPVRPADRGAGGEPLAGRGELAGPAELAASAGVALATLIPASTWDVPTFWGLYLAGGGRRCAGGARAIDEKMLARLPALALPVVVAFLIAVPYFVGYQSQPLGLGVVKDRTPLISMLILFGPALLVVGAARDLADLARATS